MVLKSELQLAQAFKIVRGRVKLPDVTVKLGAYEWQVHADLLTRKSGFFRVALEGPFQESTTRVVILHDDDPWTLARLIQFLYESSYETARECRYGSWVTDRALCLRDVIDQGAHAEAEVDADVDGRRECRLVHCLVINLADKYDVPDLLDHATERLSGALRWPLENVHDHFWSCFQEVGIERVCRHTSLQDTFTSLVTKHFPHLDSDRLGQWCRENHGLCHKISQNLSRDNAALRAEIERTNASLPKSKRRREAW